MEDQLAEVPDMQARAGLDAGVEDIVAEAEEIATAANDDTPAESKASLLKGMRERKQSEIALMDEEYRREILERAGLADSQHSKIPALTGSDSSDEKYVPRPRLGNVLSIQERMMQDHAKEK